MILIKITLILSLINIAHSYGAIGHKFLGSCTEKYLKKHEPLILNKINTITNKESFKDLSVWPDRIKNQKKYQWTKPLHYIDILECKNHYTKDLIEHYCENRCITSAILELAHNFTEINTRESLSFLIHFIQDFNQPLHLKGDYKGGNKCKVILNRNGRNKTTNLHYLWDSDLPNNFIKTNNFNCLNEVVLENIKNDDDFYKMLISVLDANIQISCKYIYKSSCPIYISFEEYYDESIMYQLFDNYMYLIINTLKYLLNKK